MGCGASFPLDNMINIHTSEFLQRYLGLTKSDINALYNIFLKIQKLDQSSLDRITCNGFFTYFDIDFTIMNFLIFGWLQDRQDQRIRFTFLEFAVVLCYFLTLQFQEFAAFVFVLFDADRNEEITLMEVMNLIKLCQQDCTTTKNKILNNVLSHLKEEFYTNTTIKNKMNLSEFCIFFNKHTSLVDPIRQLGLNLRRSIFGEPFWDNLHKSALKNQTLLANVAFIPKTYRKVHEIIGEPVNDTKTTTTTKSKSISTLENDVAVLKQDILSKKNISKSNPKILLKKLSSDDMFHGPTGKRHEVVNRQQRAKSVQMQREELKLSTQTTEILTKATNDFTTNLNKNQTSTRKLNRQISHDDMINAETGKQHHHHHNHHHQHGEHHGSHHGEHPEHVPSFKKARRMSKS
jgi:hypothetical protein